MSANGRLRRTDGYQVYTLTVAEVLHANPVQLRLLVHLRLLRSDQAIYVVGFSLGGPVSSSSWTISSWNLPYARRKSTLGVAKNRLPGYSKRHSITTTYHASRRHAADAAQSRNPSCEVAGATPPLPGRQGVRGSNPRCSTYLNSRRHSVEVSARFWAI